MFSALVVLALLIGGGFVLFAWAMRLRICRPRSFFLGFGTYAIVLAAMWAQDALSSRETEASRAPAKPVLNEGFATSSSCRSCHPDQYTSWHASYHRTMTQVASPAVIVAPFDGAQLSGYSETGRVERRGDEFWVETVDPEWEVAAMSAGSPERATQRKGPLPSQNMGRIKAGTKPGKSKAFRTPWVRACARILLP